jgi:hypothetical protein
MPVAKSLDTSVLTEAALFAVASGVELGVAALFGVTSGVEFAAAAASD